MGGNLKRAFASSYNIEWIYHIPYYPQAAELMTQINTLFKQQLKKLGDGSLSKWKLYLMEALKILNNRPIGQNATPFGQMKSPNLQISHMTKPSSQY